MVSEKEIEAAVAAYDATMDGRDDDPKHPAMDGFYWPREAMRAALTAAEQVRASEQELIPHGVYFRYSNFYNSKTCAGMGNEFYEKWKRRAWEFPGKPEPLPSSYPTSY